MRKLLAILAFSTLLFAPRAFAQGTGAASSFDPCSQFPKQTANINIASATTTQLVALQANSPVYVCGMVLNQVNGTGSVQLEYGTGTTCGTGTTTMTGIMYASTVANGITNQVITSAKDHGSMVVAPAGNAVCALSTGSIQQSGWITYVQSPNLNAANFFDPCGQYPLQSAPIAFTVAATKQLVTGVANYQMYVCGIVVQDAGVATTANTEGFEYGTGTTCGTGTTALGGVLTGALTAGAQTTLNVGAAGTNFTVPQGQNLCMVTTATGTVSGWVNYVIH